MLEELPDRRLGITSGRLKRLPGKYILQNICIYLWTVNSSCWCANIIKHLEIYKLKKDAIKNFMYLEFMSK